MVLAVELAQSRTLPTSPAYPPAVRATSSAEWRIPIFLVLTTLLSAPFWWFTRLGGHRLYISALMWAPGIAAVLTLRLTGSDMRELGWRCPAPKWLLMAWIT